MSRRKKTVEETWYDCFADFDLADQAAALKVLTELHRQKQRAERKQPKAEEDSALFEEKA